MNFQQGRTYWVEHPKHGTIEATLAIASENRMSLAFLLDDYIALGGGAKGGLAVSDGLLLLKEGDIYKCIVTGDPWTIYEDEPAKKLPTK